jgi:hypothetical protein
MTGTDLCVQIVQIVPVIFEPPCTRRLGDSVFGLLRLDSLVGNLKLSISVFSSRLLNTLSTGDLSLDVCSLHLTV